MSLPLVFAWIVVAILVTWFVMSCFYDIRSQKQQKRIAKLERDLAHAEFELNRADSVREQFQKECG